MIVTFGDSATIRGELPVIWQTVTDVVGWPSWDPHFLEAGMDEPFQPGASGWSRVPGSLKGKFTITAVEPERSYSTESPMPMGMMYVTNSYAPAGPGRVEVSKRYELHGGFVPFFKMFYLKGIQRQLAKMFVALEEEALRRTVEQEQAQRAAGGSTGNPA